MPDPDMSDPAGSGSIPAGSSSKPRLLPTTEELLLFFAPQLEETVMTVYPVL